MYNASENRRVFAQLNTVNDRRSAYQVLEEKTPSSGEITKVYGQHKTGSYQTKSSYSNQTKPQVYSRFFGFIMSF